MSTEINDTVPPASRPRRSHSGLLAFASLLGVAALVHMSQVPAPESPAPSVAPAVSGAPVKGAPMGPQAAVQGAPMGPPAATEPAAPTEPAEPEDEFGERKVTRSRRQRTDPSPMEQHQQDIAPKAMEVDPDKPEYLLEKYLKLSFDVLGDYDYEPPLPGEGSGEDQIPAEIRAYSGKTVAVEGYMTPLDFENGGSSKFVLMNQPPSCCFGGSMRMNDWILVTMAEKKRVKPSSYLPVIALGELEVKETFNEYGEIMSVYTLKGDDVHTSAEGGQTISRLMK